MKCKACNDETNKIKAGKTKAGTQKYKCKVCGKYYTQESKKRGCLYWIRKYAKNIEPKVLPKARLNVIEIDELYSFVEKKTDFTR